MTIRIPEKVFEDYKKESNNELYTKCFIQYSRGKLMLLELRAFKEKEFSEKNKQVSKFYSDCLSQLEYFDNYLDSKANDSDNPESIKQISELN